MEEKRVPTTQELKSHFMEIAWPIVDSYVNAALGKEDLKSFNSGCREEVWELVKKLMIQSSDKMNLDIDNPRDILLAVENGECTFKEAEQLLDLYQRVKDIEQEGGAVNSGNTGLLININTSSENQLPVPEEVTLIECKTERK